MLFIGKPITGRWMREVLNLGLSDDCTRVRAAIAYASRNNEDLLLGDCVKRSVPLQFYGRYDETCAVDPEILRWFLTNRRHPVTCKLVPDWLHAKVIWFEGAGLYVGSANLTMRAWNQNFEAGVFLNQTEIERESLETQMSSFFDLLDEKAHTLTDAIYQEQLKLFEARNRATNPLVTAFEKTRLIPSIAPLTSADVERADRKALFSFKQEWNSTLEILRGLAEQVSAQGVKPAWVPEGSRSGWIVDQFLNAYYFQQVRRGAQASRHAELHDRNRQNPVRAVAEAVRWWQTEASHVHEVRTLLAAPRIYDAFSRERLRDLSEEQWVDAASRIFALGDHAGRESNVDLGLTGDESSQEEKVQAFCRRLYRARSVQGQTILDTLFHVLWGPGDTIERLWDAVHHPRYQIAHVGKGTLGEALGWARPEDFPPRNGRTGKALYALGYPVRLWS